GAVTNFHAGSTEQSKGGTARAGGEEDGIARIGADGGNEAFAFGVGEVLRNRAAELPVLADCDVRKSACTALFRPLLPRIELAARMGCARGHDAGADVRGLELPERGIGEVLGQVDECEV